MNKTLCPKRYNSCLQGLHGDDIITPGTSTVAKFKTTIMNLQDSTRLKQSVSKRLKYVMDYYYPTHSPLHAIFALGSA